MRIISENTAHFAGGSYMSIRWLDLMKPQPVETRTPEEIIQHMKDKLSR